PGSLPRFYKVFCIAFSAYSVLWICGWMTLRGHPGSVVGLLAGTAAMGWLLASAFDAQAATLKIIGALFVLNSIGYFVGGWVEGRFGALKTIPLLGSALPKSTHMILAKLLWGVCYGVGFGAGLGLAFHLCQTRTRAAFKNLYAEKQITNQL